MILTGELEDHSFAFAHMGLNPVRAGEYLSAPAMELAFDESFPQWSDYSHVRVSAVFCPLGLEPCNQFADLFEHSNDIARCADLEQFLQRCDAVVLLNTWRAGEQNLALVSTALRHHKPVFVDKFPAPTLAEAIKLTEIADSQGVMLMSESALHHAPQTMAVAERLGAETAYSIVSYGDMSTVLATVIHPIAHAQLATGNRRVAEIRATDPAAGLSSGSVVFEDGIEVRFDDTVRPDFALQISRGTDTVDLSCQLPDLRMAFDNMLRGFFDAAINGDNTTANSHRMIDALVIFEGVRAVTELGSTLSRAEIISRAQEVAA